MGISLFARCRFRKPSKLHVAPILRNAAGHTLFHHGVGLLHDPFFFLPLFTQIFSLLLTEQHPFLRCQLLLIALFARRLAVAFQRNGHHPLKKEIVKPYHVIAATVVVLKMHRLHAKRCRNLMGQQLPIASTETVYCLFHISHE